MNLSKTLLKLIGNAKNNAEFDEDFNIEILKPH